MEQKKLDYYRNIFQHVTEMFPNGQWLETMKRLAFVGNPSADVVVKSWEEFHRLFAVILQEYADKNNLTISQLMSHLI